MKIYKALIILMMAVVVAAGVASATPVRIASITDQIDGPARIAVDAKGNLYVTQSAKGRVAIYSSEGKYIKSFSVPYPVGIAVDANGLIYVGSASSGKRGEYKNSVNIYSADLSLSGRLGIGAGEVGYPNDIAVGSDGKVFVVDTVNHLVKVYDPAAGTSFSFGGFGSTSGLFKRPSGIAVNDTAGEVYVIDSPVITTTNGPADGARIQVFNKSGQFLRSFGQFGTLVGQMSSPLGIAIDGAGLLYVTDTAQNTVHILNPADGTQAGSKALSDPAKPMVNPIGVAVSKNGLAYVVSFRGERGKGRIDVHALDGSVSLAVNPLALTFNASQYAGNPASQTVVISNVGSGTLNWSASADQDWIQLGAQDPVGPTSAGGLAVGVNTASFVAGTYTGTITIDSGYGKKQTVGVTVNVVPPTALSISNGWLNFTAKKGMTPASQGITIGIENLIGSLAWSVASDSPSWLTVSPAAGTASAEAPASVSTVSVNTTGLAAGSYSGVLTVSAAGAIGTGSKITINLEVTPVSKLAVMTNVADAKFTISGPAAYSGSGASWSVEDAPAGQYTVTFDPVNGYKKPLAQTKTLIENGETSFTASYLSWQDLAAKKNIIVAKGSDVRNDSRVRVYKADGTPAEFDMIALETMHGTNVAAGDVDGDGAAEVIVGAGIGGNNPATVRIFRGVDKSLVTSFTPFGTLNGVKVAAGDLNGDGKAEVIVSSPANGGETAVYTYDNGKMMPTGISLSAAMMATVADTEGDGLPELATSNGGNIRIWKIDPAGGVGSWTATLAKGLKFTAAASITAADVDGDGIDEIIAGQKGGPGYWSKVIVFFADGTRTKFGAFYYYNCEVSAADLDGDGIAEIIVGRAGLTSGGTNDVQESVVQVYSATGVLKYSIGPFGKVHDGVTVAVGDMGL